MQRINETKSCFFGKMNKIVKPLAKINNRRRPKRIKLEIKASIAMIPMKFSVSLGNILTASYNTLVNVKKNG
jgi:hypothetical protein